VGATLSKCSRASALRPETNGAASSFDATGSAVKRVRAPNPIEALARLWLAVHANSRATD
jgi:hypothetical protein